MIVQYSPFQLTTLGTKLQRDAFFCKFNIKQFIKSRSEITLSIFANNFLLFHIDTINLKYRHFIFQIDDISSSFLIYACVKNDCILFVCIQFFYVSTTVTSVSLFLVLPRKTG